MKTKANMSLICFISFHFLQLDVLGAPCIQMVGKFGLKNFYVGSKELNWFASLEYCHNLGMSLATVENDEEAEVIQNYIYKCTYKKHLWVAATDFMKEGEFHWLTSRTTMSNMETFSSRWLSGQPDGNLAQNCVLINGVTGKWEDQSCSFQFSRPLCQNFP